MAEAVGPAVTTKWVVQKNAVALAAAPGFVDTKKRRGIGRGARLS